MYSYHVYGLGIYSELALPGLTPGHAHRDIIIKQGTFTLPALHHSVPGLQYATEQNTVYLNFEKIGAIRITDGNDVVVSPYDTVENSLLTRIITGTVLGVAMHQRHYLVLHASAVATSKGAILCMAKSGEGKSTLATALHHAGYPLIADDIIAIEHKNGRFQVLPGVTEVKLWPDTIAAFGKDAAKMPRISAHDCKHAWRVSQEAPDEAWPIARIYTLESGTTEEVLPLTAREAVFELVRNTYGVNVLHTAIAKNHFHLCTELAKQIPVCRFNRPKDFSRLSAVLQCLEDDLADA